MKTSIYIDGLNFYHGCLKGTPYQWLDYKALLDSVLGSLGGPRRNIAEIKYFTSLLEDTKKRKEQEDYISALLSHIPEFCPPIFGEFKYGGEKKTDVNLASEMLHDAWQGKYECGVLVSNDSDLQAPLRLIRRHKSLRQELILVTPVFNRSSSGEVTTSEDLGRFVRHIRRVGPDFVTDKKGRAVLSKSSAELLSDSQLPDVVLGAGDRDILKPRSW